MGLLEPADADGQTIDASRGVEKLRFALEIEGDWPPVATESVWCERHGDVYELQNAPFFINGLAYGDKFAAVSDPVNGCIFEFQLVEASGHSLVWVINNHDLDFTEAKQELLDLGCSVEGFPAFRLHSIDVPPRGRIVVVSNFPADDPQRSDRTNAEIEKNA